MTPDPILSAPLAVQIHLAFAAAAVFLGPPALLRRRRDTLHKALGYGAVIGIGGLALSGLAIVSETPVLGPFGPIHLLVPYTLWSLWQAIRAVRGGRIDAHRAAMRSVLLGAVGLAGAFTLMPGRRLQDALFPDAPMVSIALGLSLAVGFALALLRPGRRFPLGIIRARG